jgi:pyruvate,water dikinase
MTLLAAAGQGRRRLIQATGDLFGQIPDEVEIPVLPVSRWTVFTTMLPATVKNRRRIRGNVGKLDAFLATAATRCDDLLGQIRSAGSPADLTACWHADLLPHLHECNLMLEAGTKRHGGDFLRIRRTLRRLVGEADTNALLLAAGADSSRADSSGLASLGPLEGLQQLMSGQTTARHSSGGMPLCRRTRPSSAATSTPSPGRRTRSGGAISSTPARAALHSAPFVGSRGHRASSRVGSH